jgi:hypothetical protein
MEPACGRRPGRDGGGSPCTRVRRAGPAGGPGVRCSHAPVCPPASRLRHSPPAAGSPEPGRPCRHRCQTRPAVLRLPLPTAACACTSGCVAGAGAAAGAAAAVSAAPRCVVTPAAAASTACTAERRLRPAGRIDQHAAPSTAEPSPPPTRQARSLAHQDLPSAFACPSRASCPRGSAFCRRFVPEAGVATAQCAVGAGARLFTLWRCCQQCAVI